MSRKPFLPLLAALAGLFLVADVRAASTPAVNFTATAKVNPNCTVTESGTLDFNNYDPTTPTAQAGSRPALSTKCPRGSHPLVSLGDGSSLGGSSFDTNRRAMLTGAGGANKALAYDLLQPSGVGSGASASSTNWGSGGTTGTKFDAGVVAVA